MKLWVDAQLPPKLCEWLVSEVGIEAPHVRDLGLLTAEDPDVFKAARVADVVVMTQDRDFVELLHRRGPPPRVLWVRLGNTSNANLQTVLAATFGTVMDLLSRGEVLVEITRRGSREPSDAT